MKALPPLTWPQALDPRQPELLVLAAAGLVLLALIATRPGSNDPAIGLDGHGAQPASEGAAPVPARKSRRSRHSVAMPFFSFSARS